MFKMRKRPLCWTGTAILSAHSLYFEIFCLSKVTKTQSRLREYAAWSSLPADAGNEDQAAYSRIHVYVFTYSRICIHVFTYSHICIFSHDTHACNLKRITARKTVYVYMRRKKRYRPAKFSCSQSGQDVCYSMYKFSSHSMQVWNEVAKAGEHL